MPCKASERRLFSSIVVVNPFATISKIVGAISRVDTIISLPRVRFLGRMPLGPRTTKGTLTSCSYKWRYECSDNCGTNAME